MGKNTCNYNNFLKTNGSECITLSFENIEQVLGFKLPNSAYKHSAWWSNNIGSHTQAHSWIDVGYKTQSVQLGNQDIFIRDKII